MSAPNESSSLFRKACDNCTKAKSKCDGNSPCSLCSKRGIDCVYSFRKRRGGKRSSDDNGDVDLRAGIKSIKLSPYERRLWTCFFTIFKNSNKAVAGDDRCGLVWCWFARQLVALRNMCDCAGRGELCAILDHCLDSLNLRPDTLKKKMSSKCPFSPSICSHCTAIAVRQHNDVHCPTSPVELDQLKDTPGLSGFTRSIFERLKSNTCPALVWRQEESIADAGKRAITYESNKLFETVFNMDDNDLNGILRLTGNGFLPWAGDILARLLVFEEDLASFVQIIAIKFERLGLNDTKTIVRDIPSIQSYPFWTTDSEGNWCQQQYLLHFNLRFMKSHTEIISEITMCWEFEGPSLEPDVTQSKPLSVENAPTTSPKNCSKRQKTDSEESSSSSVDQPVTASEPLILGDVEELPVSLHDDWTYPNFAVSQETEEPIEWRDEPQDDADFVDFLVKWSVDY